MRLLYNRSGVWTLDALLQRTHQAGDCRVWTKGKAKYGNVWHDDRAWKAHRLSYHLATGFDVRDVPMHHKCANTLCINPEHIEPASTADNTLEMNGRKAYEAQIRALEARVKELEAELDTHRRSVA